VARERTIRPSDRRLSAKLVSTFADRVRRVVSATDPHNRILVFLDRFPLYLVLEITLRASVVQLV
jgi:hypothetical protein